MRITRAEIERRAAQYEKEYGFNPLDGWAQVEKDLRPIPRFSLALPRAVAYGAYMALNDLLDD